VVAADRLGIRANTGLSVGEEAYVSWGITNTGPNTINDRFYVDLYYDDIVVERWSSRGMSVDYYSYIEDWVGLETRVRVQPGVHTLRLVVDATGLIQETDESDNVYEKEFTWQPPISGPSTPTPVPDRLPDLVPYAIKEWGAPLIATSYSGDTVDGPLSVDVTTYVRTGVRNQGLSSIIEDVVVHLYVDDVLETRLKTPLSGEGFSS